MILLKDGLKLLKKIYIDVSGEMVLEMHSRSLAHTLMNDRWVIGSIPVVGEVIDDVHAPLEL